MFGEKILGGKAYGSIGHLPNSRLGPGDHSVHEGQAKICTIKPRKGDRVIVQEKSDGCCMAVYNHDYNLVPLTRSGYHARQVTYPHLKLFADYVEEHHDAFTRLLKPGERVVGEWLAMAHGTIYDPLHPKFSPFVAFDIFRDGKRVLFDEFAERIDALGGVRRAHVVHDAPEALPVEAALAALGENGFHGATEPVEGAVWRVEREGRVDFLAKFVRGDKIDGKYFEQISGKPPIWHWRPVWERK